MTTKQKPKDGKQWIFIDESGKPEVYASSGKNLITSNQASKYLVLSAIRSLDQLQLQQQVTEFRLSLLKDQSINQNFSSSYSLDSFHAQIDYQFVRTKFFEFITTLPIKIDVIVVEKMKSYDTLQRNPGKMYGIMTGQLIKNLCHQVADTEIVFSRKDSKLKLRQELEAEVERVRLGYVESHPNLNPTLKLSYFHNPHYSHSGLQIADYVSFAIYQVYERNNREYYEIIKDKIGAY